MNTKRDMAAMIRVLRAQLTAVTAERDKARQQRNEIEKSLLTVIAELEAQIIAERNRCAAMENGIAYLYLRTDRCIVAEVCDESIDKSGGLLGRIRELSAAIAREKEGK